MEGGLIYYKGKVYADLTGIVTDIQKDETNNTIKITKKSYPNNEVETFELPAELVMDVDKDENILVFNSSQNNQVSYANSNKQIDLLSLFEDVQKIKQHLGIE